ncbi:MAG TPA: Calx-beta domain-containing protein, partial [Verrucomicrobiae bacterium]|nr:Calx-beta domain-containing protein [Verrucomicrobiae bacterium]
WTNASIGRYTLSARAQVSSSLWLTSAPVNITVEAPVRWPIVSLESSPSENAHTPELCAPNVACPPPAGFVVRRTGPTTNDLNVYLSYSGTATPDVDYYALSDAVTIPAGADSIFVPVLPKDDDLAEGPETVLAEFLKVPAPLYMEDPFHSTATVIIDDDEFPQAPILTVVATDCFAVEPPTYRPLDTATFQIRRSGPTNSELELTYSLEGTAENGIDYETLSGRAVIPSGSSAINITIWPLPDDLAEGTETVILRLVSQPQYQLGTRSNAVALISDNSWINPPNGVRYGRIGDSCLHICWAAETGRNFQVELSSDLRNWEPIFDVTAVDGAVHFVEDQMISLPHRFYRLLPKPTVLP